MRIVNRAEFLALEGQVLYTKFTPMTFSDLAIKTAPAGDNDWVADTIGGGSILHGSTEEWVELLDRADANAAVSLHMDFEYSGRDGSYDNPDEVKFAIFEEADNLALVQRLLELLPNWKLAPADAIVTPAPEKPLPVRLYNEYWETSATTFQGFLADGVIPPAAPREVIVVDLVKSAMWDHVANVKETVLLARLDNEFVKLVNDPAYHMPFSPPIEFVVSQDLLSFKHNGGGPVTVSLSLPYDLMYILYADRILEAVLKAGNAFPWPIKAFLTNPHPAHHSVNVADAVMALMPEILKAHPSVSVMSAEAYAKLNLS